MDAVQTLYIIVCDLLYVYSFSCFFFFKKNVFRTFLFRYAGFCCVQVFIGLTVYPVILVIGGVLDLIGRVFYGVTV